MSFLNSLFPFLNPEEPETVVSEFNKDPRIQMADKLSAHARTMLENGKATRGDIDSMISKVNELQRLVNQRGRR